METEYLICFCVSRLVILKWRKFNFYHDKELNWLIEMMLEICWALLELLNIHQSVRDSYCLYCDLRCETTEFSNKNNYIFQLMIFIESFKRLMVHFFPLIIGRCLEKPLARFQAVHSNQSTIGGSFHCPFCSNVDFFSNVNRYLQISSIG